MNQEFSNVMMLLLYLDISTSKAPPHLPAVDGVAPGDERPRDDQLGVPELCQPQRLVLSRGPDPGSGRRRGGKT